MDCQPPNSSFQHIKKILVVKLKHIGDVLLSSPCIRALKETFPSADIYALVNEGTESMLQHHPSLKKVILFPRRAMKTAKMERIRQELSFVRQIRNERFDMVVDLTSGDRAAWISLLSGGRYRLAYDPQGKGFLGKRFLYTHLVPYPTDPDLHEVKKNLGVLEPFGIRPSSPQLEMHVTNEDLRIAEEKLLRLGFSDSLINPGAESGFVLVHPTSRWLFKCWDDQRFAKLIDWLQKEQGHRVLFTCGPDSKELERAQRILDLCTQQPTALLGNVTLTQWAALVQKARIFVGVDSAPMHIAASQGTPSVVFFGPTGFQNWRPWGVPHVLLVHDCPCSRDRRAHCDWTPGKTRACLAAITLEEAQKAVLQMLEISIEKISY